MLKDSSGDIRVFARSVGQVISEDDAERVAGAGPINDSTTWTRLGCSGGVCTDKADDSYGGLPGAGQPAPGVGT